KADGYQSGKENETENLERQKTERRRTPRRGEAALCRLHGHDPAEAEHRHHDGNARIAELPVNTDSFCRNKRGLCYQENQPTGKNDAMENIERWEMKFRKETVEKKGTRESRENDCRGQNGDKEIKAAVAKTGS